MKTPATYNEFVRWFNVRKFGDLYNLDTKDRERIYNHLALGSGRTVEGYME